jgi:hypothetical protein
MEALVIRVPSAPIGLFFAIILGLVPGCQPTPEPKAPEPSPPVAKKAEAPNAEIKEAKEAIEVKVVAPVSPAAPAAVAKAKDNPLLAELLGGVAVPGAGTVKLPPPTMADGLDADGQRQAINKILPSHTTYAQFIDRSSSAPVGLKIRTVPAAEVCRTVDLCFVAHGRWSTLISDKFADSVFKTKKNAEQGKGVLVRAGFLTPEEMRKRGLDADKKTLEKSRYFYTTFTLLDRVEVSTTRHAMLTQTPSSVVVAARVDGQFADDPQYSNYWRSVDRDAAGQLVYGKKQPYIGAGFYMKVTKLAKPADTVFVEYHSVFHEPKGWFDGENLLRSKLPTIAQFEAKQFRSRLAKASEGEKKEAE